MDRLFASLGNTSAGWSALSGDVVAIGPTGTLVNLTVKAGGTPEFTAAAHSQTSLYAGIGALFALILVALAVWAVLRYRRRSADAADDTAREAGAPGHDADSSGGASTGTDSSGGSTGPASDDDG